MKQLHGNKYFISTTSMTKKLSDYYRLCRWHQPIGAMLLYWPTAWGVCLGSPGLASFYYIALFLMGSWTSRSAGCIVNDYLDREFDRQV
jgi:4-hydroxybenzoate polyprenyltransferase